MLCSPCLSMTAFCLTPRSTSIAGQGSIPMYQAPLRKGMVPRVGLCRQPEAEGTLEPERARHGQCEARRHGKTSDQNWPRDRPEGRKAQEDGTASPSVSRPAMADRETRRAVTRGGSSCRRKRIWPLTSAPRPRMPRRSGSGRIREKNRGEGADTRGPRISNYRVERWDHPGADRGRARSVAFL